MGGMGFSLDAYDTWDSAFAFESCIKTCISKHFKELTTIQQIDYNTMNELQISNLPFGYTVDRTFKETISKQ